MTIIYPITDPLILGTGHHQLYATNYFESVAKNIYDREVRVKYLLYKIYGNSPLLLLFSYLVLTIRVMITRHDALYFSVNPKPLVFLSVMRILHIYNREMYAWKYTPICRTGCRVKDFCKSMMYGGFTRIFMMTRSHVAESVTSGLVKSCQLEHLNWGVDSEYIDSLAYGTKHDVFTFVSNGCAYRDFVTMCKAFRKVKNARLVIYTVRRWKHQNHSKILEKYGGENIEVIYNDQMDLGGLNTTWEYITKQMHKAHCSLCICHQVDFGVGYTQTLDSIACGLPVIATKNRYNPIDVERAGVGFGVDAYDVDSLADRMNYLVDNPREAMRMGECGRKLQREKFSNVTVAENVVGVMLGIRNK